MKNILEQKYFEKNLRKKSGNFGAAADCAGRVGLGSLGKLHVWSGVAGRGRAWLAWLAWLAWPGRAGPGWRGRAGWQAWVAGLARGLAGVAGLAGPGGAWLEGAGWVASLGGRPGKGGGKIQRRHYALRVHRQRRQYFPARRGFGSNGCPQQDGTLFSATRQCFLENRGGWQRWQRWQTYLDK